MTQFKYKNFKVGCGTLALGGQYRNLAMLLAYDLYSFHSDIKFYVLTDMPEIFSDFPNVIAIKHQSSGVRSCYHDKRHVVSAVLRYEDVCLFLDADSRLIDEINFDEFIRDDTFLVAPWAVNLYKKLELELLDAKNNNLLKGFKRRKNIFLNIGKHLDIDISDTLFIKEAIFSINKHNGDYATFIKTWDFCAKYTTTRLLEASEGSSIGISAKASKCKVYSLARNPDWYFNDYYINHWKTNDQKNKHAKMAVLRNSIGKEPQKSIRAYLKIASYCWRYFKFTLKNLRN